LTWFDEALHNVLGDRGYMQRMEVTRWVARQKSAFQDIEIFDTKSFGRVLALDGIIQTTESDEHAYHEMLVHVPILAHGNVRRVMVVGGGDGGVLREILRHSGVEHAREVEIDADVVNLCREHMPGLSDGAYEDPRTELIIGDGLKIIAEMDETYDVIIVDSTDPVSVGEVLFTQKFYDDCRAHLTPGGILTTQSGVPFLQSQEMIDTQRRLETAFADATVYLTVVPTYVGGYMALGWGSDEPALRDIPLETLQERYDAASLKTWYYSPAIHAGAFTLPPFITEKLAS
jgi:spermidine synthase